ncbi:FxsB family cyclophane-forming radical SAM/SPASM peptide maturase [Amycolatopsis sp. NBC_01286]|uniref:FxsB family cyclophane-forming radical SAM/SPASM peptide maturase n=1 Tax=Amycolatopsis sp. NBC_01286 TaxID=2903560 RepID=UPI002E0D3ED2|nr:FxsB family radical SAM/SPASM domain protein [Amycolatopsis sp. NBC_01286]
MPAGHARTAPAEWPADLLDVSALRTSGWTPVPFRQFLLKVNSRCNIACDYCYVYEMADQSWQAQPTVMSDRVVERAAERIARHATTHELDEVRIILHGGEPLLAGREFFRKLTSTFDRALGPDTVHSLGVQTNAVLLDEDYLDLLLDCRIRVGVSLDGGRATNDRHRRYRNGRSTYDQVADALELLATPKYRPLFTGLLATIDIANDPVGTYEDLLALEPPSLDFLLPHGNWTARPPHRVADPASTPYADWLIPIFDRWYLAPRRETGIRFFEELINLVLGGRSSLESIGLTPVNLIVVETDGSLEQVDSLKAAFDGAAKTGLNVFDHDFDVALENPSVAARQIGVDGLSDICRSCRVLDVCGGGLYPHRYQAGSGFLNPSVYCPDLLRLIDHVHGRVAADLARVGAGAR